MPTEVLAPIHNYPASALIGCADPLTRSAVSFETRGGVAHPERGVSTTCECVACERRSGNVVMVMLKLGCHSLRSQTGDRIYLPVREAEKVLVNLKICVQHWEKFKKKSGKMEVIVTMPFVVCKVLKTVTLYFGKFQRFSLLYCFGAFSRTKRNIGGVCL